MQDKNLLEREIETLIKTSFIFALAEFERTFMENYEVDDEDFQEFRKAILDNGNKMIRRMRQKIKNFNVEFKGYNVNFINQERM